MLHNSIAAQKRFHDVDHSFTNLLRLVLFIVDADQKRHEVLYQLNDLVNPQPLQIRLATELCNARNVLGWKECL